MRASRRIADLLNGLSVDQARAALLKCCTSSAWVEGMLARRPFADDEALLRESTALWESLSHPDWLEAFAGHPKIGDVDSLRKKYGATRAWAEGEQKGVAGANEDLLRDLARLNDLYEKRFGYIFIVCATGKSATEMLEILKARIDNDPEEEIRLAAAEQDKITRIRLEKLGMESAR